MKQIITKDGKVYCTTTIPYPKEIIKLMKQAGYKVKEIKDEKENEEADNN